MNATVPAISVEPPSSPGHRRGRCRWAAQAGVGAAVVAAVLALVLALAGTASAGPAGPAPATPNPAPTAGTSLGTVASPTPAPAAGSAATPPGIDVGGGALGGATTPTPAPDLPNDSGGGGPGFFDVTGHIKQAINGWFTDLVTAALNPVLKLLGHTILASPDVAGQGRIHELWTTTLVIANSLTVLLIVAAGAVVMGYETVQTRYTVKELLPRLIVAVITANASLSLLSLITSLVNALVRALIGDGVTPAAAGDTLVRLALSSLTHGSIVVVLGGLVVAVLAITLLASYVIRVALLVLLAVAAPLALILHALPYTESAAQLWWRATIGCFTVQVAQALVFITGVRVFLTSGGFALFGFPSGNDLVNLLVCGALLYVLIRIPGWVNQVVFRGSQRSSSTVLRLVRYRMIFKLLGAVTAF